ncbi:CoA activase [Vallitalea pronyensis]|uniref:CoA activase n=1 Tax=Vallitalea pronyensis TaxID=1348613 RepID=A0A8J8MLJ2_9FIRM|nr:acyl-CoA dehydratase activase [Vallitalea pronyensis]QUI23910.1 CoA activase [Vallitalea pronyensis]
MYSLGIDIGYSSIKVVVMNQNNEMELSQYIRHKGHVKEVLESIVKALLRDYDPEDIQFGAVTGNGSKFLTKTDEIVFVNEAAAIVEGSRKTNKAIQSIIEIGGQSAKYITRMGGDDKSKIEISMNSNCSAGTGSFLEEQMSRLNLNLEDYSIYASKAKSIPRIAGRCSVFAKTDMTHHQQEGVPIEDILLGLAYAVVKNYKGAIMKKLPVKKPILFAGGVAHNQGMITALKDVLDLQDEDLVIPDNFSTIGALGAAVIAKKDGIDIRLNNLLHLIKMEDHVQEDDSQVGLPRLATYGQQDSCDKHICQSIHNNETMNCYLGIDVGSTSTNLVLMNEDHQVVSYQYLRTLGNPIDAVRLGLKNLKDNYGDRINVIGAGTTGSGRYMIGQLIGADVIKDEITAQAKAAVTIDKDVDTIFEIGGQDSKYISLENGVVTDFQMNKICAAGTGSFIEEQAKKFNIPIDDFGNIALQGDKPINLGERCTVFIETSIAAQLARGAQLENIASGLCYAIAKNYIGRVVGQKKIGKKIFFQGGVAYNQGVINAFRALTGKDIVVPPFFSVTGAYGAAILTKENMNGHSTTFKGFTIEAKEDFLLKRELLKAKVDHQSVFNEQVRQIVFEDYKEDINSNKKTVGIPRALFTYGMFSMFHAIFKELGYNVLLSDATSEETIRLGQQYALDETCYPVKLITGHVAELVKRKVDYIFFPDLFSVDHPGSMSRVNYGCAYMQLAFKVMKQGMSLDKEGIELLAPTMAFNLGKDFMTESFANMGKQLGKDANQTQKALKKGMEAYERFEERMGENGKKILESIKPDEKAFVIVSKIYGVADPVLNMGIPATLMDMGYKVLPFYDLPEGDVSKEHPNMFWPFGQHILEPAQLIKQHPNLYGVLLTHHGCGPDSVLSHYFREEMSGKPYLHIEVDEHSSGVGVITRVEAFINSLQGLEVKEAEPVEVYADKIIHKETNVKREIKALKDKTVLYLPYLYPYSEIFKALFINKGVDARVLPKTSQTSLDIGRKFTITEEYFSLTALLGDVFKKLQLENVFKEMYETDARQDKLAFFIPQNEGTETDGQYSRLLRTKLDEEGFEQVDVISPFIEDTLYNDEQDVQAICLGLLAGDIIRTATKDNRSTYLDYVVDLIKNHRLDLAHLQVIARDIYKELSDVRFNKRILATGEVWVLYNDFLNNFVLTHLEDKGHRVIYSPLSETIWLLWKDFLDQNTCKNTPELQQRLMAFKESIQTISECLANESPFEKELDNLATSADRTVGYYAGGNGRYREAKLLGQLAGIDGNISVASMYENTGIVLGILHKGFESSEDKPILNLTVDGNKNENIETKVESFMYYL